jgi:hypothetical protein
MRLSSAVIAVSLCGVALAPEAQQIRLLRSGTQEALLDLRTAATLAWRWKKARTDALSGIRMNALSVT